MLIVFIRTIILYFLIVIIMRLMGKRQIGQLQPSELVVALIIADLAAIPMGNTGIPLLAGIIPILTLFVCEAMLSYISLKSQLARRIISGKPSIVIEKGKILENELRKQRFNIDDLMEQLRLKDVFDIQDVEYAILETGGQISILLKTDKKPVIREDLNIKHQYEGLPISLIIDGRINCHNLSISGHDMNWLNKQLSINGIKSPRDVLYAYISEDNKFVYMLRDKAKGGYSN
ncbi:DUF421 domain-containing protein [Lutispora thermophila]|uniref:DUF421 domain-containing protein n=1 Tax=Lutispora thermophila TaxID=288966 RepID=UPI000932FD4D|nr:DUF421 domain-containing protein [Lutispora thermophila]